jgi:LAO/AO transport system kinase
LRSGSRAALARAITLIESRRGDHQATARDLVQALPPDTGKAIRVAIIHIPLSQPGGEHSFSGNDG